MIRYFLPVLLVALPALAQHAEVFDTSGMPRRPAIFVEQQIFDLIRSHRFGDLADAARVQRKLGSYYLDRNDQSRARAAFLAAAEAEATESASAIPAAAIPPESWANPSDTGSAGSGLSGSYYGLEGRTLHTWEFHRDSTFLHTWISSGSGTSVRNSERGRFRLAGDVLEIQLSGAAGGFTTPGVGGRNNLTGGVAGTDTQIRRLTVQRIVPNQTMVLDGIVFKLKTW